METVQHCFFHRFELPRGYSSRVGHY